MAVDFCYLFKNRKKSNGSKRWKSKYSRKPAEHSLSVEGKGRQQPLLHSLFLLGGHCPGTLHTSSHLIFMAGTCSPSYLSGTQRPDSKISMPIQSQSVAQTAKICPGFTIRESQDAGLYKLCAVQVSGHTSLLSMAC